MQTEPIRPEALDASVMSEGVEKKAIGCFMPGFGFLDFKEPVTFQEAKEAVAEITNSDWYKKIKAKRKTRPTEEK